jgi:septal ring factor EnvC (AmiA/AmiB activator)
MPSFTGFLITFCIGVAATLGWQSYGDAAREMIASSYPQLGWLAPKPAANAESTPEMIALATPDAPSPDQQQFKALSHDLDAMRQSVDRIAASQEQITRSFDKIAASQEQITRGVDRIAAGQQQMTREITKLQEIEQYVLYKSSESPPPAVPAPAARGRAPRPSQAPTPPPPATNP